MKKAFLFISAAAFLALVSLIAMPAATASPQASGLDAAQLKSIIEGMGYEPKVLNAEAGKEKYEWTVKRAEFDVPIAAELSASKNFIWVTAFLGKAPDDASTKNAALLKRNAKIQPSMFWVSEKGNLMIGVAIENRAITPVIFKRHTEKLVDDVVATADIWNK